MPTQKRVRLDDVEPVLPVSGEASEQDETNPVLVRQFRPFDLPSEDDQLLTQQHVFGHKIRATARDVGEGASRERSHAGSGQASQGRFGPADQQIPEHNDVENHGSILE